MKKTIVRLTLFAVLLMAAAATPARADGPGDPPPGNNWRAPGVPMWVIVLSSLFHI